MPEIGRPVTARDQSYANVQMAPRKDVSAAKALLEKQNISEKEKERLINKIQGYKPKNDLIVDGKNHNKMGKDEFLKLLTVQLQNQDPMNPMKQEKMAAELAQFSQLEQLSNLNAKFDGLTKNQQVQDKFYGASFLGKEVVTSGSSLKYEGEGTDADILFTLPKPAAKVLVRIFDSKNNMVGEMWKENIGRGNQTVTWDGMQLDNSYSGAGEFRTQVFAWDQSADPIAVETKTTGLVQSVFFENGETVLKVDGKKVFLRDVDSFHSAKTTEGNNSFQNRPSVNKGQQMAALYGRSGEQKSSSEKLPLAQNEQAKVNLNNMNKKNNIKSYQQQIPTTGITDVYDD
ncbi:MAG: flagellar hook capping FlgD N-terminal domain-containing protein [Bacteriovoracaceae bacterium]|jgi:flagellar basal-body rod modification protein FlgD|nr:hypothetical protein [Halobacteriovoraceae bacterium]MDP7320738.1 flagellar hook capping FlgD N-terminal domain-containing protein [Bacteriovoracaceae bacterium]